MSNLNKQYRILGEGEIIQSTDEADMCANNWRDDARWELVPPHMVGRRASDPKYPAHTKYRRVTSNPNPTQPNL